MAHHHTIFAQLLKFLPRHEFEQLAKQHHKGGALRTTSRWSQFIALTVGQLAGRQSLRDIESNMKAQAQRLYHLGAQVIARSSLSRLNEQQPYTLYEALFAKLYTRCHSLAPQHGFRFKNPLLTRCVLDRSVIASVSVGTLCTRQGGDEITCGSRSCWLSSSICNHYRKQDFGYRNRQDVALCKR